MTKCDFCENSRNVHGVLVCPYTSCLLSQSKIMDILNKLAKVKR